jgi:pimeloyl-ACP methyl ester carboxylesterase
MEKVTRDGVTLAYDDVGSGEPPLVFVHGWTCDHTYFAPQVDYFSRDHRTIAVDLRGHGESDKPEQPYTMEGFADDVAWLCGQLGISKPVIIGHSLGGTVALALAVGHPTLPAAIVAIDAPWLAPQNVRDLVPGLTEAFKGPQFRETQRQVVRDAFFLPSDDQQRRDRIADHMSSAPQHVMLSAWEHVWGFDSAGALAALSVPALYIGGGAPLGPDGASTALGTPEAIRAQNPRVVTGQTVGAGHFSQLDAADQVNAMIARFLATALTIGASR